MSDISALPASSAAAREIAARQGLQPVAQGIAPVHEIVAELKAGRMVILVDEEDRENEGDLVLAADFVTPEAINFMATHARGLICLTLTQERCQQLGLSPMSQHNGARYGTAFTTSIEAAEGVTTGISAADRARTIKTAVARQARPQDLVQPGHVFPIQAVQGGVLMRAGHTEAGCDLTRMAGCTPAAVICEIMNADGTMARLPDLQLFAAQHGLKIGTIADLIEYRSRNETLVSRVAARPMMTAHGEFMAQLWRDTPSGALHLTLTKGQMKKCPCACMSRFRCWTRWSRAAPCTPGAWMRAWPSSPRPGAAWPCCSIAAKAPISCWRSLRARRAPAMRPSADAWICAATAWARKSCASWACAACSCWACRAACRAWPAASGWR